MLKDGQLCSPGAVSDGGHPMLTEALNGVSYNNLGNSSSVSPSAFTKRQALCQFINVAYILLLTSVALDKFTTSSRDNISISAPQTYLAAVSLSEVVNLSRAGNIWLAGFDLWVQCVCFCGAVRGFVSIARRPHECTCDGVYWSMAC